MGLSRLARAEPKEVVLMTLAGRALDDRGQGLRTEMRRRWKLENPRLSSKMDGEALRRVKVFCLIGVELK